MAMEKAQGVILRTTDWSETSRIATLWTREFGKVRALAKGGRRLRSNFENALDLLTVCSIVLLRKTTPSLDLLTEARVLQRFAGLRTNLNALYAAYYVAELLSDWTSEHDPHPPLYDEAIATLQDLGGVDRDRGLPGQGIGPRVMRFELVLLRELGYGPTLEDCAGCGGVVQTGRLAFSPEAGGVVCAACQPMHRDRRSLSLECFQTLQAYRATDQGWRHPVDTPVRVEMRHVLGQYITYRMGKRPRLLPYLES